MRPTARAGLALALLAVLLVPTPAHAGIKVSIKDPAGDFMEPDSGTKDMVFKVVLSAASSRTVKVDYRTVQEKAKAGKDFQSRSGTLTFQAGETKKSIKVPIIGDLANETNFEWFYVKLSDPVRATIGRARAEGVILNDDPVPDLVVSDASSAEGGTFQYEVSLTWPSYKRIHIGYWTGEFEGTATPSEDYAPTNVDPFSDDALVFAPGETTVQIPLSILPDTADEPDETLVVHAGGPEVGGDPMGPHTWSGTITILDDD